VKTRATDLFTIGVGGEKTQPTGTVLEDVVVDELEVSLLEVVETTLEDVVVDEEEISLLEVVEVVEVVELVVGPSNLKAMLTPRAITTMTRTAKATAILPIPLREVLGINRKNKRGSIFKTSPGSSTVFEVPFIKISRSPREDHPAGATTCDI